MPRSTSFHIHDILQLDSKPSQEETEVQGNERSDFSMNFEPISVRPDNFS